MSGRDFRAHRRFESLAGAIALGEATADERAQFELHVLECAVCRADAVGAQRVLALVEAARTAECWQPSVRDEVARQVEASRARRYRTIFGVFGYAIAASIVLNVAVAGGFGTTMATTSDDSAGPAGTPMTITLEPRPRSASLALAVEPRPVRSRSSASARRPAPARAVAQQFAASPQPRPPIVALEPPMACRQRLDAWAFDPACRPPMPIVQTDIARALTQ